MIDLQSTWSVRFIETNHSAIDVMFYCCYYYYYYFRIFFFFFFQLGKQFEIKQMLYAIIGSSFAQRIFRNPDHTFSIYRGFNI